MSESIIAESAVKRCTKCGIEKPTSEFARSARNNNGLRSDCKACNAAYRAVHRQEKASYNAAHYAAHIKEKAAYDAAYRVEHRQEYAAHIVAWRKAKPEKNRAINHRHRARKLNAPGTHTAQQVKDLLVKQKCKCVYCKINIRKGYHVDHIIALANGGGNSIDNIQLLCPTCNCSKSDRDNIEFAQRKGLLL